MVLTRFIEAGTVNVGRYIPMCAILLFYESEKQGSLLMALAVFGIMRVFPLLSYGGMLLRSIVKRDPEKQDLEFALYFQYLVIIASLIYLNDSYYKYAALAGAVAAQYNIAVGLYQTGKSIYSNVWKATLFFQIVLLIVAIKAIPIALIILIGCGEYLKKTIHNTIRKKEMARNKYALGPMLYSFSAAVWMVIDRLVILKYDINFAELELYAYMSIAASILVGLIQYISVFLRGKIVELSDSFLLKKIYLISAILLFFLTIIVLNYGYIEAYPFLVALLSGVILLINIRQFSDSKSLLFYSALNIISISMIWVLIMAKISLIIVMTTIVALKLINPYLNEKLRNAVS